MLGWTSQATTPRRRRRKRCKHRGRRTGLLATDVPSRPFLSPSHLRVVLVDPLQAVVQVHAALGAQVDVVRVKDGAPEEAAAPLHLSQGQVVLARDVKVGDAHVALGAEVRDRPVHGVVEGRDHWKQTGGRSAAAARGGREETVGPGLGSLTGERVGEGDEVAGGVHQAVPPAALGGDEGAGVVLHHLDVLQAAGGHLLFGLQR